ncbi:MAG: acylneuraminate cytidylyltransferase [Arcobacter sp.]|uniref:glycosyltransferase family protein n=1 Tax=uncultured Arcobacter sp. TaxID=165434 RepID=UPI000CBDF68C|nr:glycosyltransferase family protein [uncultured Arcobacter sp.]PLY10509.1 MAG: acylneuraminate cytidylyltransferase [Arcobacter sp.]
MIVAIIQARMGSTRLPGKVLKEVNGKPLLAYQLERVQKSKLLNELVVATSTLDKDDSIESFCKDFGIDCFRGSEDDVLSRYYECAVKYNVDTVVRLTADCPLSDPDIIDAVIQKFLNDKVDYCANTVPVETGTFPDGMDVEVFSMKALKRAKEEEKDAQFREHVTFQFWQTARYKTSQLISDQDYSKYRITVDYAEDFEVVSYVLDELKRRDSFGHLNEIVDIINENQEIIRKNKKYYFGQGWA